MQRQQEAQLRKRLEEEQKQQIDETHWVVEGFEEESFPTLDVMNESTFDLSVGRRSFGDFNPQVEVSEFVVQSQKNSKSDLHHRN